VQAETRTQYGFKPKTVDDELPPDELPETRIRFRL
jgi:hypothetical protein